MGHEISNLEGRHAAMDIFFLEFSAFFFSSQWPSNRFLVRPRPYLFVRGCPLPGPYAEGTDTGHEMLTAHLAPRGQGCGDCNAWKQHAWTTQRQELCGGFARRACSFGHVSAHVVKEPGWVDISQNFSWHNETHPPPNYLSGVVPSHFVRDRTPKPTTYFLHTEW